MRKFWLFEIDLGVEEEVQFVRQLTVPILRNSYNLAGITQR